MGLGGMEWTGEQADAITATGDVLLAASAGTGKTTTVVGKILWMLGLDAGRNGETGDPLPTCPAPCTLDEIAAITFTEKAAYDLKRKLRVEIEASERGEELRWEIDRASVGTIHAFCGDLLRDHALRLEIDPTFRVMDERETRVQQDELLKDVLKQALADAEPEARALVRRFKGLYDRTHQAGAIGNIRQVMRDLRWHSRRYAPWLISEPGTAPALDKGLLRDLASRAGLGPPDAEAGGHDEESLEVAADLYRYAHRALARWLSWLEAENLRDFDSLILDARRLLTRPETRPALEAVRSRYRILIIDEFQDTDAAQRDIAFAIAGLPIPGTADDGSTPPPSERPQLFLVGDPKQSIYRFRGADIGVWNEVREVVAADGQLLELSYNFRSEPQVVRFVNRVCGPVMAERAADLGSYAPRSAVGYVPLREAVAATSAGGLEWLVVDGKGADARVAEARLVASRIRQIVGSAQVRDPDLGRCRAAKFSDIAILGRTRAVLRDLEGGLRQYGVPFYNSSAGDLTDRQEILDLVTALRLVDNPSDDLQAFAWLRSPFVGLRDETLARIRLDPAVRGASGRFSFVEQARTWLEGVEAGTIEMFPAPENPEVHEVEAWALREGLEALDRAHRLVDRATHGEIVQRLLHGTGYRLHLLLREHAAEALANIERFQALLEDYRHLPLGGFLRLWDRWGEQDTGVPQAPLTSQDDDAVTLSTVHTAKGLEWPIVILAGTRGGLDTGRRLTGTYWSDPELGPVFMGGSGERGPRSDRLFETALAEDYAEEARLLYVAATRARDRLVVAGPAERPTGYALWLAPGLDGAVEAHEATSLAHGTAAEEGGGRRGEPARDDDSATGTGKQLDAFGFDDEEEDALGQLNMFAHRTEEGVPAAEQASATDSFVERPLVLYREPEPIQASLVPAPVEIWWLDGLAEGEAPPITRPVSAPRASFSSSATELRVKSLDPAVWELRYRHGVVPKTDFCRLPSDGALPATLRGTLIHTVLERLEAESELARILGEAIAGLDAPESETLLEPGSEYRERLEAEISAVVRSAEWSHYVAGPNWRELPFLHLVGPGEWRLGSYDLFRSGNAANEAEPWIIDFKTHQIEAEAVPETAAGYQVQVAVYREAASAILDAPVRVSLHFTHPNVAIDL